MKYFISLVLMSFAAASNAGTLTCNMEQYSSNWDWIAPNIRIDIDETAEAAKISDSITEEYVGRSVKGAIVADTANKLTITWTVKSAINGKNFIASGDTTTWGVQSKLSYRLSFFKADGTATVTADGNGYYDARRAPGTCVLN